MGLGHPVLDAAGAADLIEAVDAVASGPAIPVARQIGELDSVVGEHGVDSIRNGFDECFEEGSCRLHIGLVNEFDHSELRGPVDGHEEVELALGRSYFGQIDMEEADRIAVKHVLPGLVTLDLRQPADAVTLIAAMQRRACQMRNGGFKG